MPASHQVHTIFKSDLFVLLDYRCAGGRARQEEWPHAHEIVLPRSGVYVRRDAFGEVVADPNQILFSNRNQPYEISHPVEGEDRSTVILLKTATLLEIAGRYSASVLDRPRRPFPRAGITTLPRLHLSQQWLVSLGGRAANLEPIAVEESVLALIGGIFARLFTEDPHAAAPKTPGAARQRRELVHRARLILAERFQERLSLDRLAAELYSSPYHLCRVFKAETGLTIHQYQQRLRLLHAAEWIAENPRGNFDRLALELGFASHSHFSAAFGKTFNLSPSDFRSSMTGRRLQRMSKILKA